MIAALLAHANAQHAPTVDCPACRGYGEVQTGRDYFGQPETATCSLCDGRGDVNPWAAADWRRHRDNDQPPRVPSATADDPWMAEVPF